MYEWYYLDDRGISTQLFINLFQQVLRAGQKMHLDEYSVRSGNATTLKSCSSRTCYSSIFKTWSEGRQIYLEATVQILS